MRVCSLIRTASANAIKQNTHPMRPSAEAAPIVKGLCTKRSIPIAHPINPNRNATRAENKNATKKSAIHKNPSALSDQVLPRAIDTRYKTFGYVAWNVI